MSDKFNAQQSYDQLVDHLKSYIHSGLCLAFSGGVDSTLLLKAAMDAQSDIAKTTGSTSLKPVTAITFMTMLHPQSDLDEARYFASELGSRHEVLYIDEFQNPAILKNPIDRCYQCKKMLFQTLCDWIQENDYKTIIDGTNLDDTKVYRPGIKALAELGIKSPLKELNFTKQNVREMAALLGMKVSKKPSTPCMATRFPYDTTFDRADIARVEQAEIYLKTFGFTNVRLRIHQDIARIEIDPCDFTILITHREEIIHHLKDIGYTYITLDLEGFRSGSMDVHLTL